MEEEKKREILRSRVDAAGWTMHIEYEELYT